MWGAAVDCYQGAVGAFWLEGLASERSTVAMWRSLASNSASVGASAALAAELRPVSNQVRSGGFSVLVGGQKAVPLDPYRNRSFPWEGSGGIFVGLATGYDTKRLTAIATAGRASCASAWRPMQLGVSYESESSDGASSCCGYAGPGVVATASFVRCCSFWFGRRSWL